MSTDPQAAAAAAVFNSGYDLGFDFNNLNPQSSTMSIETLDLADVLKNPHVKSLHEKWTHATEQVMNISENQTNLVQENARLRIEIAVLKAENHQPVTMGPQSRRSGLDQFRAGSIAPSDSVSRFVSGSSSSTPPNFANGLDLGNSSERPDGYEREVLWNFEDCKTDPDVDMSPANMARPAMDKAIRHFDGRLITKQEWRSIKSVANAVKHRLLTLPEPKEPAAHLKPGKRRTKTYFCTWLPSDWNNALLEMEKQAPLLGFCSQHWKAEYVLSNSLQGDKAHKQMTISSDVGTSSESDTTKTTYSKKHHQHSKKRQHLDSDEDKNENNEDENENEKRQTKKRSQKPPKARPVKKTKMACDGEEKQKDNVSVAATKRLETSDFSGGGKGATASTDKGTTAGGDKDVTTGGDKGTMAGGGKGAVAGGDNSATASGDSATAGMVSGATAGVVSGATAGRVNANGATSGVNGTTASASATNSSFIDVDSSYESLKRIFVHDFPAVPHSTDLLVSMQSNPTFADGPPSDPVVAFLTRIQDADPNSPEFSEDNTNANWGHYQFSGNFRSVLTEWSGVGGNRMARKLIAATVKTCKVACHLCYEQGIHPTSYLSDAYLNEIVERLWTMWKEAGGPVPATVPPTTTPGLTVTPTSSTTVASVAPSSLSPSTSQTAVTQATLQGLNKDELKDLITRQGLIPNKNCKKDALILTILSAPTKDLPSDSDVATILQERKKKKAMAGKSGSRSDA